MRILKRRKVALVANPNAGKHTPRAGLGAIIGSVLASPANPNRIYDTKTLEELSRAARQIQMERPEILAVAGGDGTLHKTLTSVFQEYERRPEVPLPQILLIPIGTMNNVATAIGATRYDPVTLARRIDEKIKKNRAFDVVHVRIMKINGEYGFMHGAGLPVNFLQAYYSYDHALGKKRIIKVLLSAIWDELLAVLPLRKSKQLLTRPIHARIKLPDDHEPPVAPFMTHTAFMAATIDQVGFGCRAMPDAMRTDGCFMIRSSRLTFWGFVASIGHLWAGLSLPSSFDAAVSNVVIEYEQPTVTMVDGEIKPPRTSDVIESGPLLTFIIG